MKIVVVVRLVVACCCEEKERKKKERRKKKEKKDERHHYFIHLPWKCNLFNNHRSTGAEINSPYIMKEVKLHWAQILNT